MTYKLGLFAVLVVLISPVILIGMVVGTVWVGLKIGFNAIDWKMMEWILND